MRYLVAVICPPAAVLLSGRYRAVLFNSLLTLCLWVPGVIHAIIPVNASNRDRLHTGTAQQMRLHRMNSVIRKA